MKISRIKELGIECFNERGRITLGKVWAALFHPLIKDLELVSLLYVSSRGGAPNHGVVPLHF